MSKTIAVVVFKDMPGKKFKIKRADGDNCFTRKDKMCCFLDVDGCMEHARWSICHSEYEDGHIFVRTKK